MAAGLVLARLVDQRLILRDLHTGEIIGTILVVEIASTRKIRLGLKMRRDVEVLREEIADEDTRKRASLV
jgi:sRNA-binding carbon storage regulator CsrA